MVVKLYSEDFPNSVVNSSCLKISGSINYPHVTVHGMIFHACSQHVELARCHRPQNTIGHDDVIKCKHFPRYWPFV